MDSLVAQEEGTAVNGLSMSGVNLSHAHTMNLASSNWGGSSNSSGIIDRSQKTSASWTNVSGMMNSALGTHTHTLSSTDVETRPDNFTVRIWKRVS